MAYPSRSQADSGLFTVDSRDDSDDQPTSAPDLKLTEETYESGVPVPPRKTLVKQEGPLSSNTTSFKQVKALKIGRPPDDDNVINFGNRQKEKLKLHEELEKHPINLGKRRQKQLKLHEELEKHPINLGKRRKEQTILPINLGKRRKEPLKQRKKLEKRRKEKLKLPEIHFHDPDESPTSTDVSSSTPGVSSPLSDVSSSTPGVSSPLSDVSSSTPGVSSPLLESPPLLDIGYWILPSRFGTGMLFPDLDAIKAKPDQKQVITRIKIALESGGLPRKTYINKCISKFKKKHDVVISMCDAVSNHILSLSRKIKTVVASYIITKPSEVVFVISHEDVVDTDLRNAVACYDVYFRNVECMSNEAEKVLYREDFQKDVLSRSQNLEAKGVINKYSKQMFSNHSNLNVISVSRVKSSGFMSAEEKILPQMCIVLYVSIKGFIPLQEEPFPTSLGGYKTDVMEGDFLLHHKTAKDIHDDLKTGCQIHCPHSGKVGTIGPLVRMDNKECFLTCSHIVCTSEELKIAKERGGKYELSLTECMPIYQPHYYDGSTAVGKVTQVIFKEGNTAGECGMDVAVVEKTDKRPISGVFPDCTGSMWEEIGFRSNSELFYSGETCSGPDDIEPGSQAVMFGSQSGLSRGIVRTTAAAVRKKDFVINETPYTLYDQLEILEVVNSAGKPFAKKGDSGALVFMKRGNGPVVALGLFVGCTKSKQYIATPIWEIYREVRCMPLTLNDRPSLPSQSTMAVVTSQEFGNFRNEVRNEISGLTTKVNAVEETLSSNFQTLFSILHGKAN